MRIFNNLRLRFYKFRTEHYYSPIIKICSISMPTVAELISTHGELIKCYNKFGSASAKEFGREVLKCQAEPRKDLKEINRLAAVGKDLQDINTYFTTFLKSGLDLILQEAVNYGDFYVNFIKELDSISLKEQNMETVMSAENHLRKTKELKNKYILIKSRCKIFKSKIKKLKGMNERSINGTLDVLQTTEDMENFEKLIELHNKCMEIINKLA